MKWKAKDKRFVAFFDILGFKEMVLRSSHEDVLKKLDALKTTIKELEKINWTAEAQQKSQLKLQQDQSRAITFSDSIVFFSKSGTIEDLFKIVLDSYYLMNKALSQNIAIKGAISFGEVTVDFKKALFFGQPIIDAYLLHEDMHILDVILDHNAENQINSLAPNDLIKNSLHSEKVKMKFGSTTHTVVRSHRKSKIEHRIEVLKNLYSSTSGKPRQYIDNTIDHYSNLKPGVEN